MFTFSHNRIIFSPPVFYGELMVVEGLDDWVLDLNGSGFSPAEPVQMKKPRRLRIPKKAKGMKQRILTHHSAFSKAAWCLIEATTTSLEQFEWECSPLIREYFQHF